jgi:hypothetical protein
MAEDDPRGLQVAAVAVLLEESGGAFLAHLAQLRSDLELERAKAPALLAELLALPAEAREERLGQDIRLQTWGLCELLIARSGEALPGDPDKACHLAALALAGSERLDPQKHAPTLAADLAARAWAAAGEALLRRQDLAAAEEALQAAAACLAQGTGDLLVEARLLEFEAAVRRDQRRGSEAAALLKMAAARYREVGDGRLQERALAERDLILGRRGPARLIGSIAGATS